MVCLLNRAFQNVACEEMVAPAHTGRLTKSTFTGFWPSLILFLQIPQWFLFFGKTKNKPKRNTVLCALAVFPESQRSSVCRGRTPVGERVWERKLSKASFWRQAPDASHQAEEVRPSYVHSLMASSGQMPLLWRQLKYPQKPFCNCWYIFIITFSQVLNNDHLLFWFLKLFEDK